MTVHGRVQGVGFRWHARRRAQQLGVTGWVRNTSSGSVDAHLEGEREAVEALLAWFAVGPPSAHITGLEEVLTEPIEAQSFQVLA
ncbi:MAG: acylphosphatase [Acidimicrobiia bacterium]